MFFTGEMTAVSAKLRQSAGVLWIGKRGAQRTFDGSAQRTFDEAVQRYAVIDRKYDRLPVKFG